MSLLPTRRPRVRRATPGSGTRWSTFALVLPALVLVVMLFGSMLVFAYRSAFPGVGGQTGALGAVEAGALDGFFWEAMGRTVLLAALGAVIATLLALIVVDALVAIGRAPITAITLVLLFTPLVVSMAVRGYGWLLILDQPLIGAPIDALGTMLAPIGLTAPALSVVLVLVHAMMPLTALPLLTKVREIHASRLTAAAADLGAGRVLTFFRVTLPLAGPSALRVIALTFAIAMGAFGIPAIIGRGRVMVVSELVYQNLLAVNWSAAFVRLIALLVVVAILVTPLLMLAARWARRNSGVRSEAS